MLLSFYLDIATSICRKYLTTNPNDKGFMSKY